MKAVHAPNLLTCADGRKPMQVKPKAILSRAVPMGNICRAAECALLARQEGPVSGRMFAQQITIVLRPLFTALLSKLIGLLFAVAQRLYHLACLPHCAKFSAYDGLLLT